MNPGRTGLLAILIVMFLAAPLAAHHSFSAQFDRNKPVSLSGTVTKVEWMNPHVYFYLDVADESGQVEQWALEMGAPAVLTRLQGWTRGTLKIGDQLTVSGSLARDGTNLANARDVTLSDGRELGAGSSENSTP